MKIYDMGMQGFNLFTLAGCFTAVTKSPLWTRGITKVSQS